MEGFVVVTVWYDDYIDKDHYTLHKDGVQCCNCLTVFKDIPVKGSICPGCKEKIGQIEIL